MQITARKVALYQALTEGFYIFGCRKDDGVKVEMAPILAASGTQAIIQPANSSQTKMANLPQRPPVELAFSELTYRVSEGRSKGKRFVYFFLLHLQQINLP